MQPPAKSYPGLRIILADDYHDTCETLQILLRLWGHEVLVTHSGNGVLLCVQAFRPDVAFLDFHMAGLNGGEVARLLRQLPELKQLVIVAATGFNDYEELFQPYRHLFDYYLRKPFNLNGLQSILASFPSSGETVAKRVVMP
jgi:CheY-like chemotaxis protein